MRGCRRSAAKAESASSSLNTRTAGSSKNLALGSVGPAAFGFCALASSGEPAHCSNASCGTRRIILEITLIDERILEQPFAAFNRLHELLPKNGYLWGATTPSHRPRREVRRSNRASMIHRG